MAKQLRADAGGAPWCLKPELSEGCTRACSFCGINAIRSGPGGYQWMTVETADLIARSAAEFYPNVRIEFAGHGEPLSNPKHLSIIETFRRHLPACQIMMTTAGDTIKSPPSVDVHAGAFGRMRERVNLLFEAGVSFILLDTYYPEPNRSRLRAEALSLNGVDGIKVHDYYNDLLPLGFSPYRNNGRKVNRTIVMMDDLLARNHESGIRTMDSLAGCNPLQPGPDEPLKLSCGRPFREMVFNWNGENLLCCDDWRNQYIIGSIRKHTIQALWTHPLAEAARARLLVKDRAFGPCVKCDVRPAIRSGLLPDYEPPTEEQMRLSNQNTRVGTPLIQVGRKAAV